MKHEPIPAADATTAAADPLADFTPTALAHRHDGWTADRQRRFIGVLADTGSVSAACEAVGLTARSAYRLRRHPEGQTFAVAWENALLVATDTLSALAFERATRGKVTEYWKDNMLVGQTREPSDGLLKWLLAHLRPERFGAKSAGWGAVFGAREALPQLLDKLADSDVPSDPLSAADFRPAPLESAHRRPAPPRDPDEDEYDWDPAWDEAAADR